MSYINTLQWKIEATPERIKKAEQIKKIISFGIYFLGLLSALAFFSEQSSIIQRNEDVFVKIYLGFYIVGIIIWHRFIKEKLNFREKLYTLANDFIEIQDIKSGKVKRYKWDNFKSFSRKPYAMMQADYNIPMQLPIQSEKIKSFIEKNAKDMRSELLKNFYLKLKNPNNEQQFVVLKVDKNIDKIHEALKSKLPEK